MSIVCHCGILQFLLALIPFLFFMKTSNGFEIPALPIRDIGVAKQLLCRTPEGADLRREITGNVFALPKSSVELINLAEKVRARLLNISFEEYIPLPLSIGNVSLDEALQRVPNWREVISGMNDQCTRDVGYRCLRHELNEAGTEVKVVILNDKTGQEQDFPQNIPISAFEPYEVDVLIIQRAYEKEYGVARYAGTPV
jgi:hypothetical protein